MGVDLHQAVDPFKMPGHIKKTSGPDPDPSPWLEVKDHIREAQKKKAYDPKKSCWVPNPDKNVGGYFEGISEEEIKYDTFSAGKKLAVNVNGEVKTYKADTVCQVNPPKFDCSDDMAGLTFLGDACVLWNSVVRYKNQLIYTYSGLFCIAINPYIRFPIYTQRTMEIYMGMRRSECPPHIFGVAESSYRGMMNNGKNQSILITGESGAGKTENTKKVISYFSSIGATGKKKEGEPGLEDKIVQTNPVLEAWGNAKTVRNDNSSRFGKFIRIWFNAGGKLSGADMVIYLLEKSRLTFQATLERCYHAFYNIMSDQVPDCKAKCFLSNNIYDYWWVSQGKVTVDSIDDKEDMMFADQAFDILGFTNDEKYNVYKLTAVVMHMGNLTKDFYPVGKEEQADVKDETNATKVADICGIDKEWMITYFCKPKLKVGTEWVSKGQTCSGASSSVSGIGRKIYENVFRFIVDKCNNTLIDPTMKKVQYIGCLDIAGFEIFDYNGFEQICINFCNEKLRQFFNQHMFTLEQEEYVKEGIEWANVDFGMDLQKCITMFEKPMGLLAILEEESLFPKATDLTFAGKLHENLLGKCENFQKPSPKPDPGAHFAVVHYAATVNDMTTINSKAGSDNVALNLLSTPCMLRLMTCFTKPRTLRRKLRKPWLMLQGLLMNLELSKNTPALKRRPRELLNPKLLSLTKDWLKPMKLLPRVAAMPWLSLSPASVNWRLSLEAFKARLLRLTRASKRLNVVSRSCNSNKMRITRTLTACLSWLASSNKRSRPTRSKLRRLKKLLPSTWLSTARPNKNLRKLKRGPRWLELKSPWPVLDLFFKSIMLVKVLPMSRSKTKASNQVVKRSLPTKNSNIKEHQQQIANSCSINIITHSLNYSTENALLSMLA